MRPLATQATRTETLQAKASPIEEESGFSLADIFRIIASHWIFIVSCIVLCTGLSYLYARLATPIYEAKGSIRIDPGRTGSIGLSSIASSSGMGASDELATDIAIFQSDSVAVETLNTLSDDQFRRFAGGPRSSLAFSADALKLTPAQEDLLANLKNGLSAKELGTTQLITVSFRSPDPQMAASIVNAAMAAYLKVTFDNQYSSVKQVRTWLSAQMNDLRNQVVDAQKKLTAFQEENNILATGENSNTTLDALRTIGGDLTAASAARITREAQLRAADSGQPEAIAAIFPSPTMTALVNERATLITQINQLSSKFDVDYPPLQEARSALQKNNNQFKQEIALIRNRVQQDYNTAQTEEKLLQSRYDEQLQKAYSLNRQEATYGVLLAESKNSRDLYDELERSLQQAGISAGLNAVNSMLVDHARAPSVPVEPKKTVILGFGLMLGLFCGLGAAFLREVIIDSAKSQEQLEGALKTHVLAVIPTINPGGKAQTVTTTDPDKERISPLMIAFTAPLSRSAEAFRNLRNGLLLSGDSVKTVLVSSTIAGEGKSTTVANLAVVLAQNGARVLVVDADLRRPRVHHLFNLENLQGLSNLLLSEDVADPFHRPLTSLPNLAVLTAGRRVTLPAEALGSSRFYHLLEAWEQQFDYILIDSAPLLVVSDSLPLAKWADANLLVVRYNKVSIAGLRRIRALMAQTQTRLTGLVFNDLPVKNAVYGGNDYGYYE